MVIDVPTSDSLVWNIEHVLIDISCAMSQQDLIVIDLKQEGPDVRLTGLYNYLEYASDRFGYDLSNVSIHTCNFFESHPTIDIKYIPPIHFVNSTKERLINVSNTKDTTLKHFGMFIGRSNAPRLMLASYLNKHNDKVVRSFHYDSSDDFHRHNIGLEESIKSFDSADAMQEANFISLCPIKLNDEVSSFPILKDQHNEIHSQYSKFFVEIVCETYYSGNTFFPTEKTWRPIIMKTPFIVQGPAWYLRNLQKLGFQTFGNFWDEGYSEDPPNHALKEITKVIDNIKGWTVTELNTIYNKMKPVLEHNYNTLINLKEEDFLKLNNE